MSKGVSSSERLMVWRGTHALEKEHVDIWNPEMGSKLGKKLSLNEF